MAELVADHAQLKTSGRFRIWDGTDDLNKLLNSQTSFKLRNSKSCITHPLTAGTDRYSLTAAEEANHRVAAEIDRF